MKKRASNFLKNFSSFVPFVSFVVNIQVFF